MSVKVNRYNSKTNRDDDVTLPGGEAIEIEEGHLVVKGPFSENGTWRPTIAIYAPGKWYNAEVVQAG